MNRGADVRVPKELYDAVLLLASEEGPIQERLAAAFFKHLKFINPAQLLNGPRERFGKILAQLQEMFPDQRPRDNVDKNQAVNLALEVILLYDDIIR